MPPAASFLGMKFANPQAGFARVFYENVAGKELCLKKAQLRVRLGFFCRSFKQLPVGLPSFYLHSKSPRLTEY